MQSSRFENAEGWGDAPGFQAAARATLMLAAFVKNAPVQQMDHTIG
jgi:hypothetical protein